VKRPDRDTGDAITHLVIARACDADPDGPNAQVRAGHVGEPSPEVLAEYALKLTTVFKRAFGEEPSRVGVVVLPWAGELDDPEDDE
jgi:hypothetical protein